MSKKIEILNPVGEVKVKEREMAPRPRNLRDLNLGLLDNSKHNADHFLTRAGQRLAEKFGLGEIVPWKKVGPAVPVSPEGKKELSRCHLLLIAFGD